jgi:hypothetical protein
MEGMLLDWRSGYPPLDHENQLWECLSHVPSLLVVVFQAASMVDAAIRGEMRSGAGRIPTKVKIRIPGID